MEDDILTQDTQATTNKDQESVPERAAKPPVGTEESPLYVKPQAPFERPKKLLEWQAPMRSFQKKSLSYLITLGIITAIIVIPLVVFWQQYSFSLVIIALAFVMGVYGRVEPQDSHFEIWTTGVKVGERMYSHKDLRSFWVKEENGVSILHISTYLSLPSRLTMAIQADIQDEIEEDLIKYLPYHEEEEKDWFVAFDHFVETLVPRMPQKVIDFFAKRLPGKVDN